LATEENNLTIFKATLTSMKYLFKLHTTNWRN